MSGKYLLNALITSAIHLTPPVRIKQCPEDPLKIFEAYFGLGPGTRATAGPRAEQEQDQEQQQGKSRAGAGPRARAGARARSPKSDSGS